VLPQSTEDVAAVVFRCTQSLATVNGDIMINISKRIGNL